MEKEALSLLLCTNGSPAARPALELGVHLAELMQTPVSLLGIEEKGSLRSSLDADLEEFEQRLLQSGADVQILRERGRGSVVIARTTRTGDFLTVVGPLGRPTWRRVVQGRSFRRIMAQVVSPVLYVPAFRWPIRHIAILMGGLGYAVGVLNICLYLAGLLDAQLTIAHVVEPVSLDYPTAKQVHDRWKDLIDTDTPQGRILRQAVEKARQAGFTPEMHIRHGNILHEIVEEIKLGGYDLVGMGSPYSAHSLRHLYMPNVTAEVAESTSVPVITARVDFPAIDSPVD
jgi:nucleotide-binding universal stress UspA family protein